MSRAAINGKTKPVSWATWFSGYFGHATSQRRVNTSQPTRRMLEEKGMPWRTAKGHDGSV